MLNDITFAVLAAVIAAIAVEISKALLRRVELSLTGAEKEILRTAHDDGLLLLLPSGHFGGWVRSGRRDFLEKNNPSYQAKYVEALISLAKRGLARQEETNVYRLTESGFSRRKSLGRRLDCAGVTPAITRADAIALSTGGSLLAANNPQTRMDTRLTTNTLALCRVTTRPI